MNMKSLIGAAAIALSSATPTFAATFDFSFDASAATFGDTSIMAFGTLDIAGGPGDIFDETDISNVSITVSSDNFMDFVLDRPRDVSGRISSDGQAAVFSKLVLSSSSNSAALSCGSINCDGPIVVVETPASGLNLLFFSSSASAVSSFATTASVPTVPLPAGGLFLLSGIAAVVGLKRQKKRAAKPTV